MIVRKILDNPDLIDDFDFFNDYKDTLHWLKGFCNNPKVEGILIRLKDAFFTYLDRSRQ
ncbi:hypothetical protein LCGC14_2144020 [marine sediment metagenome]|uniref:Uncharacterized protein n=1 Tax=marine sediment metagenome TaxID=412755 RepID=A0A0F9DXW1_9ZZZZ